MRRIVAVALAALYTLTAVPPSLTWATPAVYDNPLVVGNQWWGPGTYDDGIPEVQAQNVYGIIVADTSDVGDVFTDFLIQGHLGSQADIQVTFWSQGSGPGQVGPSIGGITLHASDMGHKIHISQSGVYGLSFMANDAGMDGGDFWLETTWSTDTDISTTGQVNWAKPSWATDGSSGGSTSPGDTTPSGDSTDWGQVAQTWWDTWAADIPPIPAPPGAPEPPDIVPPAIPSPPDVPVPGLPTPPSTDLNVPAISTPTPPPETAPMQEDWTSGASNAIPVSIPSPGQDAFTIPDPTDLPHGDPGQQPVPGSVPDPGVGTPHPGGSMPTPSTGGSAPSGASGPQPSGSAPALLGSIPTYTGSTANGGDGPIASFPGASEPPPPSPGQTGTPVYTGGTGAQSTPVYQFPVPGGG